jgi:hypothetical protein
MTRDSHGKFARAERTAPLLTRKAVTARSKAVAQGNRTRRSNERRRALAMFGVTLDAR